MSSTAPDQPSQPTPDVPDPDPEPEPRSASRLERVVGVLFLGLTGLFLIEVKHYVEAGEWVLFGGLGAFSRWPMTATLAREVGVHALGMLAWMGVVVHQLATRGKGLHPWVGRIGGVGVVVALVIALRPTLAVEVPALHGALGMTLMDLTLGVTIVGIVEELAIGVYAARKGDIDKHRRHLLVSVMFSAAPAVYRLGVYLGTALLDLRGPDADVWTTAWVHEMSLTLTLLVAMIIMLSRRFGAHVAVFKSPEDYGRIERGAAYGMLSVIAVLVCVYSVWLVDLVWAWGEATAYFTREGSGPFVLRALGLG